MPSFFRSRRRPRAFKWPWKKSFKPQGQFLSLPREIRDIIYHFVLPSGKRRRDGTPMSISIDANSFRPQRLESSGKGATKVTAILCTCRQVYLEASDILYKNQSFRYDPPYIEPRLLMPYGIYSDHQRAGSSSTRLSVTHLPYTSTPLSTVARFEVMEVFSAMSSNSWYRSDYNPATAIQLLAKYATNLKFLLVRLDDTTGLLPTEALIFRLPQLLNAFTTLKTIDIRANMARFMGELLVQVLGEYAKKTAELGTWAYLDLSSIEMLTKGEFPKRAGIHYNGRWLLRK